LKLLNKTIFYFLFFSSVIIFLGATLLYSSIKKLVYDEIDSSLVTEMEIIRDQIEQTKTLPEFGASFGNQLEVRFVDGHVKERQVINDTLITDSSGYEHHYRYIRCTGNLTKDKGFIILSLHTLHGKNELLEYIGLYIILLFLCLFVISILLNYFLFKRLWRPFYISVAEAEKFDIQSGALPDLPETNITEFRRLNAVIGQMTRKMRDNYLNLKEYHENSAHEIQTPLAVIRSKLEVLMQRKELKKESLNLINSINEASTKLYKINQGLLMISKIENLYFHEEKEVSLADIINNTLLNYREIMNLKKIEVSNTAENKGVVKMNELLADTLISNLISNAVRYNFDGGFISCLTGKGFIIITNSGIPLLKDPELLFMRFHREGDNPQSVGLGLSIVKKIVDTYNMKIAYTCNGNVHEIRLDFDTNSIIP